MNNMYGKNANRKTLSKKPMNRKSMNLRITTAAVLSLAMMLAMLPFSAHAASVMEEGDSPVPPTTLAGAAAAQADNAYSLSDMLEYAIEDEYAAQAEYAAIMEVYGVQRPFSNIIRSEQTHIDWLLPLFEEYGVTVPVNDAASGTVIPASLTEAYAIGVDAEIKNIAMYASFLEEDLPDDVRDVFERLMNASVNHQKAFEQAGGRSSGSTTDTRGRSASQDDDNGRGNGNTRGSRGRAIR